MSGAGDRNRELSEADDLESLAYSLAYLLCNELPWSNTGQLHASATVLHEYMILSNFNYHKYSI